MCVDSLGVVLHPACFYLLAFVQLTSDVLCRYVTRHTISVTVRQ